jgi:hypothetical protein
MPEGKDSVPGLGAKPLLRGTKPPKHSLTSRHSAQGFNPGNHPIKRIALKGREMITLVEACSYRVRFGALSGRGAVLAGFPLPRR